MIAFLQYLKTFTLCRKNICQYWLIWFDSIRLISVMGRFENCSELLTIMRPFFINKAVKAIMLSLLSQVYGTENFQMDWLADHSNRKGGYRVSLTIIILVLYQIASIKFVQSPRSSSLQLPNTVPLPISLLTHSCVG